MYPGCLHAHIVFIDEGSSREMYVTGKRNICYSHGIMLTGITFLVDVIRTRLLIMLHRRLTDLSISLSISVCCTRGSVTLT